MSKTLLLCIAGLLCLIRTLPAQENIKQYVQAHTIPLSTISPDSAEDGGLLAIARAIGDARIVFLGEEDHGDAPTFLAKTRLIKYLHEKMGFNVLAFEGDFFALNLGWERLPKDVRSIDTFIRYNIYPIWTYCHTCQELFFRYEPATFGTGTPLQLAGFDNQMLPGSPRHTLVPWLDSVMRELRLPVTQRPDYGATVLAAVDSALRFNLKDTMQRSGIAAWMDTISAQAAVRLPPDDFRIMVIRNLVAEVQEYRVGQSRRLAERETGYKNTRDRQMARNLLWLTDVRYPKEKIIVWAADEHIGRVRGNFDDWSADFPTLGSEFMSDSLHSGESYSIGFSSLEGRAGRLGFPTYKVRSAGKDGFEHWMPSALDYGFVDLKAFRAAHPEDREAFTMTGFGHRQVRAIWSRVFDGVLYIKEMYPCEKQ